MSHQLVSSNLHRDSKPCGFA